MYKKLASSTAILPILSSKRTESELVTNLRRIFLGPKELKYLKPILKLLYSLICSYLSHEVCQGKSDDDKASKNGLKIKHEDIVGLSSILFQELNKRFLFSPDYAYLDPDIGLGLLHVSGNDSDEELLLLLRCCVLLVRLHPYDQMLTEQFQGSIALLHRLSASVKMISSQSTSGNCMKLCSLDFKAKSSESYLYLLKRMLEVYLDEMFADKPFRECIAISGSVAVCSSIHFESVLDVVAAHFLLSFSGNDVLHTLIESLVWTKKPILLFPEVSLPVAFSLINHPVIMSSPVLLLSHLISLVSEVIGICEFSEKAGPNGRYGERYISTFFDSVILYCRDMSKLMTSTFNLGRIVQRPFESHFYSEIYDRTNCMLVDWDNACRAQNNRIFSKTLSSMAIDAISYIQMNAYIVDEIYRDDVLSFLHSLVTRLISVEADKVILQSFKEMTMQDCCLLAAILKLMSSSLLQATRCYKKNLGKDPFPDHSPLSGLMSSLKQYSPRIPIEVQLFIFDALKPYLSTDEELELIFVHFSSLLLLCIVSGLHILVRGCLFFMLVLMNTLALELGSLEFLRPPVESGIESSACAVSQAIVTRSVTSKSIAGSSGISRKKSSLEVASNFWKERRRLMRDQKTAEDSEISDEETCNGENYLKHVLKNQKDIDEFKDFVECNPWRDYNARLLAISKRQRKRHLESTRRMRLKKVQAYNSIRSVGKRKFQGI